MERDIFKGTGVALVTPFKENGGIDFAALAKIVDRTIDGGVDYLLSLGTTSETPTLDKNERIAVARFIKERTAGRVPLVIGMGGNCTRELVSQLHEWEFEGYSAILSVNPYYNKPNQEGLYRHFRAVAEDSPLPILLYNIPGRTGVNMAPETIARLAAEYPNIIGVKEASGNLEQMSRIRELTPTDFLLISGDDGLTVDVMQRGGVGVISVLAQLYPAEVSEIVRTAATGAFDEARTKLEALDEITHLLFAEGNPTGIKCALAEAGICCDTVRLPLAEGSSKLHASLKTAIAKYENRM